MCSLTIFVLSARLGFVRCSFRTNPMGDPAGASLCRGQWDIPCLWVSGKSAKLYYIVDSLSSACDSHSHSLILALLPHFPLSIHWQLACYYPITFSHLFLSPRGLSDSKYCLYYMTFNSRQSSKKTYPHWPFRSWYFGRVTNFFYICVFDLRRPADFDRRQNIIWSLRETPDRHVFPNNYFYMSIFSFSMPQWCFKFIKNIQ